MTHVVYFIIIYVSDFKVNSWNCKGIALSKKINTRILLVELTYFNVTMDQMSMDSKLAITPNN